MIGAVGKASIGMISLASLSAGALGIYSKIKPTNLGENLTWEGSSLLNTEAESDTHKSEWERLVVLYEDSGNNNKIDNLQLSTSTNNDSNRKENIKKLKEKCLSLFKTPLNDNELSKKEKLAKNWCVNGAKGSKEALQ